MTDTTNAVVDAPVDDLTPEVAVEQPLDDPTPEAPAPVEPEAPENTEAPANEAPAKPKRAPKPKAEPKPAKSKDVQIVVDRKELIDALTVTSKTTGGNDTPILAGVMLGAVKNRLTVTSSDGNQASQVTLKATSTGNAVGVVKPKMILDVCRAAESEYVTITLGDEVVRVTASEFTAKMLLIDRNGFKLPELPEHPVEYTAGTLFEAVGRVLHAASADEARPILTGVSMTRDGKKNVRFVTTDSYRLASNTTALPQLGHDMIVPATGFRQAERLWRLTETESIAVAANDRSISFQMGNALYVTGLIEGEFPKVDSIIPAYGKGSTVVKAKREELVAVLRRASVLGNETTIQVSMAKGRLHMAAKNVDGATTDEVVTAEVEGPIEKVGFNAAYLLDALRAFGDDEIMLQLADGLKPVKVTGSAAGHWQIVMPVRTA